MTPTYRDFHENSQKGELGNLFIVDKYECVHGPQSGR